jgi:hypothetical protein
MWDSAPHVQPIYTRQLRHVAPCKRQKMISFMLCLPLLRHPVTKICSAPKRNICFYGGRSFGLTVTLFQWCSRVAFVTMKEYTGILTLNLLMSYIYGARCKARNFNVVYIRTYVWQHWKPSLSICCTMFQHWINAESFPVSQLCVNILPAT